MDEMQRVDDGRGSDSKPAGFWRRFAAVLIDGIILTIIGTALAKLMVIAGSFENPEGMKSLAIQWLASTVIGGCYSGFLYSRQGATLGKKALGLKLVDAQTRGNVSFFRGFFRDTIGKTVSGLTLGIGYLMALFTNDHRTLHDSIFDTRVVETGK